MTADPGLLTVRADRDLDAGLGQFLRFAGIVVIDKIALRRGDPACGIGGQDRRWRMDHQRIFPDIGCLAPIGVAREPAIADHQGRRVVGVGLAEHLHDIVVEDFQRDIVLERRIAVGDQRHVHAEQRAALGHHQHILLTGSLDHLLALFAARLVVILDAVAALGLEAPDMGERVVEIVDLGIDIGRLGTIDNLPGGEDAGSEDQPGALHLAGDENLARAAGGIVDGGRSERQILNQRPVLLRHQFIRTFRTVGMGVDQARHDGLAGDIDGFRSGGDADLPGGTDRKDTVVLDDDHAIVDNAAVGFRHGDDPRAGERDSARGFLRRDGPFERNTAGRRLKLGRVLCRWRIGEKGVGRGGIDRRPDAPVERLAAVRPVDIVGTVGADPGHRQRLAGRADLDRLAAWHQRHDIGFIALPEGHIQPVGRNYIIIGQFALGVNMPGFAIEIGADQFALVIVAVEHENPVAGRAILRLGSALHHADRGSAGSGYAINTFIGRPVGRGQIAAFLHLEHNGLAIGREMRASIMAGAVGDGAR